MSSPLSDTRLAEIRERVPSSVCLAAHPDEADKGHVWVIGSLSGSLRCSACHLSQRALDSDEAVLLREVDRLRAELAGVSCPADCPCRQSPLQARWDNEVSRPNPDNSEDIETVVCCVAEGGQPIAVMLDDEHREALGLQLLLPDGDGEVDPRHLELARENEQLRAELAEAREIASFASVLCIPRENGSPLQLRQIYDNTDRWAICDRTGKRWYRAEDGVAAGWFYEPEREALCDLGRFTLAEALPLARQLATAPTS